MERKTLGEFRKPTRCSKCSDGSLHYKGLGEYICEVCGNSEFDDYGLVRNYLEKHKSTPINVIAQETGVSKYTIRQMLEEERFDICPTSRGSLR